MTWQDTLSPAGNGTDAVRPLHSPTVPLRPRILTLVPLMGALIIACSTSEPAADRIVLIVVDTLRRDHVSAYGGGDTTPRIDALAARGQAFSNVRAAFHQTTMSMGSLFTGKTPSLETETAARSLHWNSETWCGMARFAVDSLSPACLPEGLPTLGERMQAAGYWTIGVPSNQFLFGKSGFRRGFDEWVEVGSPDRPIEQTRDERTRLSELRAWNHVTRAASEAIRRRRDDHFFLYVHFMDVHDYHYLKTDYPTSVRLLDRAVGKLLDDLEREGLLAGATVVFTADHGERLGEQHRPPGTPSHYGNPSFEEVLAIPLIVSPPVTDDSDGPGTLAAPLRTSDVFHLLERIAGLRRPEDKAPGSQEHYVSERRFQTYIDDAGRWKSTIRRRDSKLFLYDLEADPGETANVAKQHPDIAAAHRARIERLAGELAVTTQPVDRELSAHERATLEALGYVE